MEAIILAGGLGTRLRGVINDCPKPMAPVAQKPFLEHLLNYLKIGNIERVIMAVGYKHEMIISEFGQEYKGMKLDYAIESSPLGTGGAIRLAIEKVTSDSCLIMNGDSFFNVDLEAFVEQSKQLDSDIAVALKPLKHFDRYGAVEISGDKISRFKEKEPVEEGLINGGIYWIKKDLLTENFKSGEKFSFETEVLEKQVKNNKVSHFISKGYFIDIGIPEDYEKAQIDFLDSNIRVS